MRDGLKVENCNIYAISTKYLDGMWVGGICGYNAKEKGKGIYSYTNCSVKNTKIGFDYEGWVNAETRAEKSEFVSLYVEPTVGAFVGNVSVSSVFENCTLENYLIATNKKTGFYGALVAGDVTFKNCTHAQTDEEWNEFAGVYGFEGKVDETDLKWVDAVYTSSPSTVITQVSTSKTEYIEGDKVVFNVSINKDDRNEGDNWWIALFHKGEYSTSNQDGYLFYTYIYSDVNETYNVGGKSLFLPLEESLAWTAGVRPFNVFPVGEYEIVLFNKYEADDVTYKVVDRHEFKVSVDPDAPVVEKTTQINVDKTEYAVGEDVIVNVTVSAEDYASYAQESFWVGIYHKGHNADNRDYLGYVYLYNAGTEALGGWTTIRNLGGKETFSLFDPNATIDWGAYTGKPVGTPEEILASCVYELPAGEYEVVLINDGLGAYTSVASATLTIV